MDVVHCIFNVFYKHIDFWDNNNCIYDLLIAVAVTVITFETARRKPKFFGSYYTPSRCRAIYVDGKRIKLDPNDKGGEHE